MSDININPPPLQIPPEFAQNKVQRSFFGALINTLYQLWNAVYSLRFSASVKTTDNTVTALMRTQVREGTTTMIDAYIVARRTGGSAGSDGDSAFYHLTGAYKNVAGVMTIIGTAVLNGGEDQSSWNVGFDSSDDFMVVTVVGDTNYNITWEGSMSVYTVGS